jgi:LPS-assembly protein
MKTRFALRLLMLAGACTATAAHGDTSEAPEISGEVSIIPGTTTIDGQRMEIYLGREMRIFGDAEIHQDGNYIKGDQIFINTLNDEIHATGNVHVKQKDITADGPELKLKMEDRTGHMEKPVFNLGVGTPTPSRGSAEALFFEGPTKERLTKTTYTTCPAGNDDWYLNTSELEVDHHAETATATHARVDFKGVPIFYTPWMDFPFSDQRKSGFLMPIFGTSTKNGVELSVPYYWNIAPDMDATLAVNYMGNRGTQMSGEHRYLGSHYSGKSYLELLPNDDETGNNRYYMQLAHGYSFGNGWSAGLDFEKVSDGQYFNDMSTNVVSTSRVNLLQQVGARYDTSNWHFSSLVQRYQTLDNISFPYQRIPQLSLSGLEDFEWATTNLYSEFVRFEKHANAPTSVEGNRLILNPSISVPFVAPYGYITPKVGMHLTKYSLSNTGGAFDSDTRVLPTFSVDSGIFFDRDMRVVKNRYTQTLEPRLFYVYIPNTDQSRLPIFDSGLSDLNLSTIFSENQFSGGDRVNDANQVTAALTSRMIDQRTGSQRLSATIAERFYLSDQKVVLPGGVPRSSNHSDILAALSMQLTNGWRADANYQFNTDTDSTVRSNLTARYQPETGKLLNLSYRYNADNVGILGLEQIDISAQWSLSRGWYGVGRLNYSLRDNPKTNDVSGPIEFLAGAEYDAGCWLGRFVFHRLPTAAANSTAKPVYAFYVQLELTGLSKIGSNPLELLKRSIPGYINSSQLPMVNP